MTIKCPKCQAENPETKQFCGDCGTPLPYAKTTRPEVTETLKTPVKELTTGSTFAGRYQIIEELGKGGMGRVYKVFDNKIKEKVALKLIKPEVASDKETLERFNNELRLARKVRHKNVCGMFDLGEMEGAHFITMEYVQGEDLKSMIRMMGQLSPGQIVSIGKQVCDGLAEAHSLGVVHRDLKPQNIMIDKGGNAKIMDFGIARSIREKGITGASVMIGTPEYMSPEQAEAKEVDQRSDIYSLGIILYEMATGRVPFEGETALSVAMKHKGEVPKNPKQFNPNIPNDLSSVILICLEKDKAKRYQTAVEFRSELEKIEKGLPTTERIVPERKTFTSRQITVQFSLKKLLVPALAALIVIAAALLFWKILPNKRAALPSSGKPSLAVLYFKNNTGEPKLDVWRSTLSDSIIIDLSQSKYINVLSGDRIYSILKKFSLLEAKTYASEDLKNIAAEGRVNHILQGSFSKAGDIFRIDYTLQDMNSGKIVGSDRVQGSGENSLFSIIDELTRKVKSGFELSPQQIAGDIDKSLGQITTNFPEAYRYFMEGRRFQYRGDHRSAIAFYEKAVAMDPEFASCFNMMATAYHNLSLDSEGIKYTEKALELSDRISDRERLRILATRYYYSEQTTDKAIDVFKNLLELYPDDGIGNNMLANLYNGLEEWDKAVKQYEINVRNGTELFMYHSNLAYAYMRLEQFDRAREVLVNYSKNFQDIPWVHQTLSDCYFYQGKLDLALKEAERAYALDPKDYGTFYYSGDAYLCLGETAKAEKEYSEILKSDEPASQAGGRLKLAGLYFGQGRFEKAKGEVKLAISIAEKVGELSWQASYHQILGYLQFFSGNLQEALKEVAISKEKADAGELLSYQRSVNFARGYIYALSKSPDEALRQAAEFKETTEKSPFKKQLRKYDYLMGVIELQKGNYSKAIGHLQKGLALEPYGHLAKPAYVLYHLASAYFRSGDLPGAQAEFEGIAKLTAGMLSELGFYAKSFYMLGKIHEQKGERIKAVANYQKFLDIWKDADPGQPEVEDARTRLAALQGK